MDSKKEELRKKFAMIDTSGDGEISKKELLIFFKNHADDIDKEMVADMMAMADADGDG